MHNVFLLVEARGKGLDAEYNMGAGFCADSYAR